MTAIDSETLDANDALAHLRDAFALPAGKTYLDGNSLGALPQAVVERVEATVRGQWGDDLIASWNRHDWIGLPARVGEKIAPLVGAAPGQVICCDSISVNLFKLLATALKLQPGRPVIVSEAGNFPTDLYMVEGLRELLGAERCELRAVPRDGLVEALGDDVAVLMLTQVNFRTGEMHDMVRLTRAAHDAGALVLWDLAHSAGVLPVALDDCGVDMAVGCGYKFLNGGPGAPAFLYLARALQGKVQQPLTGWMGHRRAFDFVPGYEAAAGIEHYLSGTPGILGMAALDEALSLFDGLDLHAVRAKSLALTETFMTGVAAAPVLSAFRCLTPGDPQRRGSQVSLAHEQGYAIAQALIEDGIVVDFRAPDIVRFGFAPMYNSFADVSRALAALTEVMVSERYRESRFAERALVT